MKLKTVDGILHAIAENEVDVVALVEIAKTRLVVADESIKKVVKEEGERPKRVYPLTRRSRKECPECHEVFWNLQGLSVHMTKIHHQRLAEHTEFQGKFRSMFRVGPFKCETCGKGFGNTKGLAKHKVMAHGFKGKNYEKNHSAYLARKGRKEDATEVQGKEENNQQPGSFFKKW